VGRPQRHLRHDEALERGPRLRRGSARIRGERQEAAPPYARPLPDPLAATAVQPLRAELESAGPSPERRPDPLDRRIDKSRTLANISDWPEAKIESLRRVLAGETLVPLAAERFEIARALAHGHVAAVLGTVRRLGLDKMLPNGPERRAKLILAMIVARIIEPAAKLATARQLSEATAAHSLGSVLGPRALRPGGRRGRALRRPRPLGP